MANCNKCERLIQPWECVHDSDKSPGRISRSFLCSECAEKSKLPLDAGTSDRTDEAVRTLLFSPKQVEVLNRMT